MKINELFGKLDVASDGSQTIFEESGMINRFKILDFGFFPLGSGILAHNCNAEDATIEEKGIMVLGNDFGTKTYLEKGCENYRESATNPTIRNLISKLQLDRGCTFFTNFYLGVRDDTSHPGTTNTKRVKSINNNYEKFCHDFFITQLKFIRPKIVICLGHAVRLAIANSFEQVPQWKRKTTSLEKLYADNKHHFDIEIEGLGEMKFIVIPHPCDTRNFSDKFIPKILDILKEVNNS